MRNVFHLILIMLLLVNASALLFIDSAGGHPKEYGPSYGLINKWGEEFAEFADENGILPHLEIYVSERAGLKFDVDAIMFGVKRICKGMVYDSNRKIRLLIDWNPEKMSYEYRWER